VEIFAVLQEQGVTYLVFEFVSGRPLDQLLASKKRLELTETLHLLGQITAGLECAHGKNIIHRDLKAAQKLAMRMEPPTVLVPGLPPHVNSALIRALNGEEGGLGASGLVIPSA
jgi:serine/threonine protein kinase